MPIPLVKKKFFGTNSLPSLSQKVFISLKITALEKKSRARPRFQWKKIIFAFLGKKILQRASQAALHENFLLASARILKTLRLFYPYTPRPCVPIHPSPH